MTKTKTSETPAGTAAVVEAGGFVFDAALPVPTPSRVAGTSELAQKLAAMPVGASFLEACEEAPASAAAGEKAKIFAESQTRVKNRMSGAVRRFKLKEGNGVKNFAIRAVNDVTLGRGVRVYRLEDSAA